MSKDHQESAVLNNASPVDVVSKSQKRRFIIFMFLVCLFDFADRSVFAVLAQSIKVDLSLSDLQIGLLQGLAFAVLYSSLGLPMARLSERYSRTRLVAACTVVWSIATFWCGMASSFLQLAIGRIGVGVGESGFLPAANSMVGDQFPRNKRASTMSLIMLGTPAGILSGALAGGYIASIAGWREAFIVLGIPGVILGICVWLFVKEPVRGKADGLENTSKETPSFKDFLKTLRRKKSLIFIIMGGATAGFGMTSISQFLAVYLARVHDLNVGDAAKYYGLISAAFLTLGLLISSFGTDRLSKRDARWPAWGGAIGLFCAPFIFGAALNSDNLVLTTVLLIIGGTLMLFFMGPSSGMIQNLLEPRMRATGIACFTLCYTLVGSGLGPVFVGFISDTVAKGSFTGDFMATCPGGVAPSGSDAALVAACATASALGVKKALMSVLLVFFVSSSFYYLASRTLREDSVA